jgi:hypothetical protein
MKSSINFKKVVILLSLFLLKQNMAFAHEIKLANLDIFSNRDDLQIYVNLQGAFQDKIKQYILIGVPAQISFFVTLYKVRDMWIDEKIADLKITHKINYNALKKEFIIRRSWEKENLRITNNFIEAQRLMSNIDHLKVVSLSRLEKDWKYQIRVKAEVSKDTQSSYLPKVHNYASKWNLETQLYTIDFIY